MCVVIGRLELSATHISFYPERFADEDDDVAPHPVESSGGGGKGKAWVPDSASDVCGGCHNPIVPGLFLTRKHHCRR